MDIDELKKRSSEDTERLREQMKKEWMEIVKDKLKYAAALFGVKLTEDAKVRSHRLRK
jgi:hypothetical protein